MLPAGTSSDALKKAATIKLVIALVLNILGGAVYQTVGTMAFGFTGIIALVLWIWGLSELARSKGLSPLLGLLGLVGCLGWIILAIIPGNPSNAG